MGACVVANGGTFSLFADPHAFERHLHLVNHADLETALRAEVFVNENDHQVRAAHKILGYEPIQRSFAASKSIIRAKDPQLQLITVAEHGFFLPGESSAQRAAETEEGKDKVQEQVIELDQSEDEFGAFEQLDTPEYPFGDTADQTLPEADFQGTSSQTDMGFKRKPSASLRDLLEGQPGKDASGKSQPKLPPPPPSKPKHPQTKSLFAQPPPAKLPPAVQPADPKRKRSTKGKEPMDGGKSRSSHEEDEGWRVSKQLKIVSSGQEREVDVQPEPQA